MAIPIRNFSPDLINSISEGEEPFSSMPDEGKKMLQKMVKHGRAKEAGRVLKFWQDVKLTLLEIKRVLKSNGGKAAIVIGDNNIQLVKGTDVFEQVPNVKMVDEIGLKIGLCLVETIKRDIEKSMTGMIRNEAIVILRK